jgi:hypothetical protein
MKFLILLHAQHARVIRNRGSDRIRNVPNGKAPERRSVQVLDLPVMHSGD